MTPEGDEALAQPGPGGLAIEIVRPGPLATVQDLGRAGLGALGVGVSGAADRGSLRLANRIVGNAEAWAGIETTLGGLVARFTGSATIAVTGAHCALRLDDREVAMETPIPVSTGEVLRVGSPRLGLRSYIAVGGGIAVPAVLGSRATDTLAGIGTGVLAAGTVLPIGDRRAVSRGHGDPSGRRIAAPAPALGGSAEPVLRLIPGPRDDWFVDGALATLGGNTYRVLAESNRIGLRLAGPALERREHRELPPEALVRGALQVPPSGQPILCLADHPVTGGYPVIAVVVDDDVDRAAQVRPGRGLRFRLQASSWGLEVARQSWRPRSLRPPGREAPS